MNILKKKRFIVETDKTNSRKTCLDYTLALEYRDFTDKSALFFFRWPMDMCLSGLFHYPLRSLNNS